MLIVVLALVIIALALLVASLVVGQSLFAWLSIAVSVLAAIVLIADVLRRKRGGAEDTATAKRPTTAETSRTTEAGADDDEADSERTVATATAAGAGDSAHGGDAGTEADELDDVEPGEERTDAADLLAVTEMADEVLVVDEHPRYHLESCHWLRSRETIPLPVREARDLGFTPCGRCLPDRALAQRSRETGATSGS